MLKPRQTPPALIIIFFALGLADGEPSRGELITALLFVLIAVLYVIGCSVMNEKKVELNQNYKNAEPENRNTGG